MGYELLLCLVYPFLSRGSRILLCLESKKLLLPLRPREDGERVRFGVERPLVERPVIFIREEEIQVFQATWEVRSTLR